MLKYIFSFFLFLFSLFLGYLFLFVGSDEIVVGVIVPLTGPAPAEGSHILDIINFSVNKFNSENLLNGKKIVLNIYDGACNYDISKRAAEKLVEDSVNFILGGFCSAETLGAGSVTELNEIILLSPMSSSSNITNLRDYVFRIRPSNTYASSLLAKSAVENGDMEMVVYYSDNQGVISIRNEFYIFYSQLGGTIVKEFNVDDLNYNVKNSIGYLSNNNVSSLFITTQGLFTEFNLFENLKLFNLSSNIYIKDDLNHFSYEKFYSSSLRNSNFIYYPDFKLDDDLLIFKNEINIYFNKSKYSQFTKETSTLPYDAVSIMFDTISICGNDDTLCMKNYLYSIRNRSTLTGVLSFDEFGDPMPLEMLGKIRNGKIIK